ncbi:Gag-Pro-Pol polyprotein [Labeo rohita]|uniref:ribonuclease H n=1 Tax=Labeo rohita TaxID=84645 RepID=A0ABQ8L9H7_LABRO|nr:Gag-Pro-Pol polyprotein [Labeo rohita]
MALRTIRHDITELKGQKVDLLLSPQSRPEEKYSLTGVFTAPLLTLTEQTYPLKRLQQCYPHLRGIPLPSFNRVQPLLLIGSDYPTLITPKEPIRLGPAGGPVAVRTQLGWVLQGPDGLLPHQVPSPQCLFTSLTPLRDPVYQHVERLWQLDVLPSRSEKMITRSKQDQMAVDMLETRSRRVEVDGVWRYATPLLRAPDGPPLKGTMESVLSSLRNTEKRLSRNPERAKVYEAEIQKLLDSGHVVRVPPAGQQVDEESWFIPHHLVQHNGKYRLVFNCSFVYQGVSLNQQLLPGPTLGASLLGVLLRFRQYAIAISGDIRGMFHQVRLLPEDRPLLRFIWRNMCREDPPDIYEWHVLPFGTTCSPCCATFALHRHVRYQQLGNEEVLQSIERSFYVDNCLQSIPTADEAKRLIDKMRPLLASGGFEIRQWATNVPTVVQHLPTKARSESIELWLQHNHSDPLEPALGLMWHCLEDSLGYRHRALAEHQPTMRYIYKVLATQYDPLGFSIPFTTRAKVLVQRLWARPRGWDDPNLPADLLEKWNVWEKELLDLSKLKLPRCYLPADFDVETSRFSLHVFGDASEVAYGSVAYLRAEQHGKIHTAFVMARSRVAPKRQLSMPRLELCAALSSAQLAQFLRQELTIAIETVTLWTDSTTVLNWIQSESCRYKVFVGTRVAEIQELTEPHSWRYVDSSNNPADDITRGRTVMELANSDMWSRGPGFLREPPDQWPVKPIVMAQEDTSETRKAIFCGLLADNRNPDMLNASQYASWSALIDATYQSLYGAAIQDADKDSLDYRHAEACILRQCQEYSFPEEFKALKSGNQVPVASRLNTLAPEFDSELNLIHVGGRLRRLDGISRAEMHPVVLDPHHQVTKLIVKHFDERLLHPGPDRVFAELRRHFWVLRGRQAIKQHQRECVECQKWRAKPTLPIMADLPSARLRLYQPPFFSTGVDCFGPFMVKIGRRREKRWGVIFKCLTTRCIHLDLLNSIDTDAFLLALRRFIARRGTPSEIFSDQGTNFRGAETELREAFREMEPSLQEQLANYQITFRMNPPAAPHFGGAWEREIRSVKSALRVVVGSQSVPEDVLQTILIEVEGILNSKPLGYVSSDVADVDPVTPNMLLMGRRDASLPQVIYTPEPLSKRRWRHAQTIVDHFWSYFTRHYLPGLQTRQKWQRVTQDLAVNTVVMIIDPQLPRAQWSVGRVVKLIPSADGHIRSAQVHVNDRVYLRPVAKLVRLPALPDGGEMDSKD